MLSQMCINETFNSESKAPLNARQQERTVPPSGVDRH